MSFEPEPAESKLAHQLRVVGGEALALARQATLLHRDWTATYPRLALPGEDVVVLLHGLFATAGVLRPMRRVIEEYAPAHTATFSYAPGPGVIRVADSLAALVDRLPGAARIHLVGHSLGGVAARWFVQELGGDPRIVQTISLASPFNGTDRGWLVPAAAGRDIRPDSAVLRRLREGDSGGVPHLSVVADSDHLVTRDASLGFGERVTIPGSGHNGLLFRRDVALLVAERVRESRPAPDGPATSSRTRP